MLIAVLLGITVLACMNSAAQEEGGVGLVVKESATYEDVGLPAYPGAKPYKEKGSDSGSARVGLWGGQFGFRLAVVQMESSDAPKQVADFYKSALSKYGEVLDCTDARATDRTKEGSSKSLSCGDDRPKKGGMLFKAGTEKKQHMVAVEPHGTGTVFKLIYILEKGD
jgi:hypothetical protein